MSTTTSLVSKWLKVKRNRSKLYRLWWETGSLDSTPESDRVGLKVYGEMDAGKYILAMRALLRKELNTSVFNHNVAKYYPKYINRYYQKIRPKKQKARGGWLPFPKKTTAVYTFLSRGFVHEDEFNWDKTKYYVRANIAPLWYPEGFDHHQDAIKKGSEIGVHGYTGSPLAGKKWY